MRNPDRISLMSSRLGFSKKSPACLAACVILLCCAFAFAPFADAAPEPDFKTDPEMKALRQKAAGRQRRILFNNDGNEAMFYMKSYSMQEFRDLRSTRLIDTQVDTILYCLGAGVGLYAHDTKIGSMMLDKTGRQKMNRLQDFLDHGTDPLKEMIKFCREFDKEIFWSMRMNDTHDGSLSKEYGPQLFNENKFKTAHRDWLLGTPENKPFHGGWSAANYAIPGVRDFVAGIVDEICKNYDIDGIELDFFRHPVFFKFPAEGKGVGDKERAMMTDLVRRIRQICDAEGKKRGRPILIAMRTPDSVEYARAIGLDLERWLAEDLMDLYFPAGYFRLNEWDYSVRLGHKHGVKVYPSMDEARLKDDPAMELRRTPNIYRGRAAEAHAQGADGIYMFNFFTKSSPQEILKHAGDPAALARMDKDYVASIQGVSRAAGGNFPHEKHQNVETLTPVNPKKLNPGESAEARIYIADDFKKNPPAALGLNLRFLKLAPQGGITVTLNGVALGNFKIINEWMGFTPPADAFRQGENIVRIQYAKSEKKPIAWGELIVQVRAKKTN